MEFNSGFKGLRQQD